MGRWQDLLNKSRQRATQGVDAVTPTRYPFGEKPRKRESWQEKNYAWRELTPSEAKAKERWDSSRHYGDAVFLPIVEAAHKHHGQRLFDNPKAQAELFESMVFIVSEQFQATRVADHPELNEIRDGHVARDIERWSKTQAALSAMGVDEQYLPALQANLMARVMRNTWDYSTFDPVELIHETMLMTPGLAVDAAQKLDDPALLAKLFIGDVQDKGHLFALTQQDVHQMRGAAIKNAAMDPLVLVSAMRSPSSVWKQELDGRSLREHAIAHPSMPRPVLIAAALDADLPEQISAACLNQLDETERETVAQMAHTEQREVSEDARLSIEQKGAKLERYNCGYLITQVHEMDREIAYEYLGKVVDTLHLQYVVNPGHPWNELDTPEAPSEKPEAFNRLIGWNASVRNVEELGTQVISLQTSSEAVAKPDSAEGVFFKDLAEASVRMIDAAATVSVIDPQMAPDMRQQLQQMELWSERPAMSSTDVFLDQTQTALKSMTPPGELDGLVDDGRGRLDI